MRFMTEAEIFDVIVIGGGAAGMMSAITASERGKSVLLIEKNDRLGKKLSITGKGRCNLTNNSDNNELLRNIPRNPKFLYSSFAEFSSADTMAFFEGLGVPLKTERGKRVFPVSDKAGDVVNALVKRLEKNKVKVVREDVRSLIIEDNRCVGVNTRGKSFRGNSVILAAGGASYPKTGSDGYGCKLAQQAGHTVVPLEPSLIAIVTEEKWVKEACGLTLRNTAVKLFEGEKAVYEDFGEVMFTADGLGGATILSTSAHISGPERGKYTVALDLKPALGEKQLDARILRDIGEKHGKTFGELLRGLLPAELCEPIGKLCGISLEKRVDEITKTERQNLVKLLKNLRFTIAGFRPLSEAIVTRGGVSVKEINPKTMESKLCPGLFFAGEIIDVDGYTGGFNLQIAFATGRKAGNNV